MVGKFYMLKTVNFYYFSAHFSVIAIIYDFVAKTMISSILSALPSLRNLIPIYLQ